MKYIIACLLAFNLIAQEKSAEAANPDAREILKKCEAAMGGKAFKEITTTVIHAELKVESAGMTGNMKIITKTPDKIYYDMTMGQMGKMAFGFDGETAWRNVPLMGGNQVIDKSELGAMDGIGTLGLDADWEENMDSATLKGIKEINGKKNYILSYIPKEDKDKKDIKADKADGNQEEKKPDPIIFYIDQESYLINRMDMVSKMQMGQVKVIINMSDYKKVQNIPVPHKLTMISMQIPTEIIIKKITFNEEVDDAIFKRPALKAAKLPEKEEVKGDEPAIIFSIAADATVTRDGKKMDLKSLETFLKKEAEKQDGKISSITLNVDKKLPKKDLTDIIKICYRFCDNMKLNTTSTD